MEAALARFQAAHTQVLGVSIDSVYSHANWGRDLGGVSFPLLSDFEPKGEMARAYGAYLAEAGITDRASVVIDGSGTVRYATSVTPQGARDIAELAATCESIDRQYPISTSAEAPARLEADSILYVKSNCGFSRAALLARDNLHLEGTLRVTNVTDDSEAAGVLERLTGRQQAPCLVVGGQAIQESADIVQYLANRVAPVSAD